MAVRLRDVADRAGVSVKTVSNVVNGYVHVSPRTRSRVEAAVAELGYRPNVSARVLRGGRSGILALAVPELSVAYFAELAQWVIKEASARGYTVLIDQTEGIAERERLVLEGIRDHLIDGLIFSPLALNQAALAARRDTTPMVLLGERVAAGPADHVSIDNVAAARDVVLHLAASGRRRIAAIGAQRGGRGETARLRLAGYRAGLREAGLRPDVGLVANAASWHRADGAAAMEKLLASADRPDAVFAFNDPLALGAVRACHDHRVSVPGDIAIVGFDDIEDGRYFIPSLSTISPDKAQIAAMALDLIVSRIQAGHARGPAEVTAGYRLVIRESSAGPG